jgi:hypothetical protein
MPKPRNRRGDFVAQITKPEMPVLWPKPGNPPPPWFWGSTKKPTSGFEAKPGETVATSFEAKLEKIVATGFEAKPAKLSQQVLRPNHSQNVDLGFEAQPRNPQSSSPHARCRPHMAPPYLSTARPSSTQHVRPSPVLCTRSPTPATVLVAACYAAPATCTPRDKQMRFFKWNKGKRKIKQTISDLNSNLAKSMTHHNQTKELSTWFLNLPLDESIGNKSTKFEVPIQDPMNHS